MPKKEKLKGFTLVEMIVVVALFGLIMVVVLGLLGPINKTYSRAFDEADKQSISEDLRRFVEDNLRYADRMNVYTNMALVDDPTAALENSVEYQVNEFRKKYYFDPTTQEVTDGGVKKDVTKERIYPYAKFKGKDEVYVLCVDNPASSVFSGSAIVPVSSDLGTVTLRKFVGGTEEASSMRRWGIKADYYDDYVFNITLQTLSEASVTDEHGTTVTKNMFVDLDEASVDAGKISPSNFAMGMKMFKKEAIKTDLANATVSDAYLNRTISFKLKNLLNNTGAISVETIEFTDDKHFPNEDVRRFEWYDNTKTNSTKLSSAGAAAEDFYIIFTKSPVIEREIKK